MVLMGRQSFIRRIQWPRSSLESVSVVNLFVAEHPASCFRFTMLHSRTSDRRNGPLNWDAYARLNLWLWKICRKSFFYTGQADCKSIVPKYLSYWLNNRAITGLERVYLETFGTSLSQIVSYLQNLGCGHIGHLIIVFGSHMPRGALEHGTNFLLCVFLMQLGPKNCYGPFCLDNLISALIDISLSNILSMIACASKPWACLLCLLFLAGQTCAIHIDLNLRWLTASLYFSLQKLEHFAGLSWPYSESYCLASLHILRANACFVCVDALLNLWF